MSNVFSIFICSCALTLTAQSNDKIAKSLIERSEHEYGQGRIDDALATCEEALKIDPSSSRAYVMRGVIRGDRGDYEAAFADLDKAIRLAPHPDVALYARGTLRMRRNELDLALKDLEEALKIYPEYHDALKRRASVYFLKRDFDKAIAGYTEAINLRPKEPNAYISRAHSWAKKAEYDKAMEDYNHALWLDINSQDAYCGRALLFANLGKYENAIKDYENAINVNNHHYLSYLHYAQFLASCDDPAVRNGKAAVELAKQACELTMWKQAEAIYTLAAAYAEMADFPEALRWQTKAVECTQSGTKLAQQAKEMLELFKQGKPFRIHYKVKLQTPELIFPPADTERK